MRVSAAPKSAADTGSEATAIPTAHAASRRPRQLRMIFFAPILVRQAALFTAELASVKAGLDSTRGTRLVNG